MTNQQDPERRKGTKDRRQTKLDRRNEERAAAEVVPRRNVDQPDRRDKKK